MCIPLIRAGVYVVVRLMGAFKNIQSFQISATNPADPAAVRGNFQNPICDRAGAQILARDWESAQQRVDDVHVNASRRWSCPGRGGLLCAALPPAGERGESARPRSRTGMVSMVTCGTDAPEKRTDEAKASS